MGSEDEKDLPTIRRLGTFPLGEGGASRATLSLPIQWTVLDVSSEIVYFKPN